MGDLASSKQVDVLCRTGKSVAISAMRLVLRMAATVQGLECKVVAMFLKSQGAGLSSRNRVYRRNTARGTIARLAFLGALLLARSHAATESVLDVRVADSSVPPGAMAQIRVMLSTPHTLVSGASSLDLDPTIFGDIVAVNVLSANGDQRGLANIRGRHADVVFASTAGGIGRLPDVPVFTVDVPVLPNVPAGKSVSVSLTALQLNFSAWRDLDGREYSLNFTAGTIQVGGVLSIRDVTPGGGMHAAGTMLEVNGTGFTSLSTVSIDGVSLSRSVFVSSEKMTVQLLAPVETTGRRVVVRNSDGTSADYFVFLKGPSRTITDGGATALAVLHALFPIRTSTTARLDWRPVPGTAFALQNQTGQAMTVHLEGVSGSLNPYVDSIGDITLEPSETYIADAAPWECGRCDLRIIAPAPIRMLTFQYNPSGDPSRVPFNGYPTKPEPDPIATTKVEVRQVAPDSREPIAWYWQTGTALPLPKTIAAILFDTPTPVLVTTSGGDWLSVTPQHGVSCSYILSMQCGPDATFTIRADPSSLKPGTYHASIIAAPTPTPGSPSAEPSITDVVLTVSESPKIIAEPPAVSIWSNSLSSPPMPVMINVSSSGAAVPFTVRTSTDSPSNWLIVTPSAGITPATLTVSADPSKLGEANPGSGMITITGPGNTQVISVSYYVETNTVPPALLAAQAGSSGIVSRTVAPPFALFSEASVSLTPQAPWLKAAVAPTGITISADPSNLAPGIYMGSVDAKLTTGQDWHIPVRFSVFRLPASLSISPSIVSLSMPSGSSSVVREVLRVTTGAASVDYSVSTTGGGTWLKVYNGAWPGSPPPYVTPDSIVVEADPSSTRLSPGVYHAAITITAPQNSPNSITIPVELVVTPTTAESGPPLAATIVNAASQKEDALAAGEIVSIFGYNLGFPGPVNGALTDPSVELHGTRVLFNGIPAQLLYSSLTQINAIVPREITGSAATVEIAYNGARVLMRGVPLRSATPGIFTTSGAGQGQASIFNHDGTVNEVAHPAMRGSTIQILATGVSDAAGLSVTLGGVIAAVQDFGFETGVARITVVVPADAPTGDAVEIRLSSGPLTSPGGVTVSILGAR